VRKPGPAKEFKARIELNQGRRGQKGGVVEKTGSRRRPKPQIPLDVSTWEGEKGATESVVPAAMARRGVGDDEFYLR
jgi:hypothetical protein